MELLPLQKGFDISGNTFLDSGIYVDPTSSNGTIHGNALEAADTIPTSVTAAVSNGGLCQITTSISPAVAVNATVYLTGVGGTGCNGPSEVVSTQSVTQFTTNRPFSGTYTSGGTAQPYPGINVTPSTDVKVFGNDIYDTPGPTCIFIYL